MPRKPLVGEVLLEDLIERLSFAEEETQSAALEQAKLYMAAADYRIRKMKIHQETEAKWDDVKVRRSLQLRAKYAGGAKKGMTERYLNDLIDNSREVRDARDEASRAKRQEEWAKLLLEAYDHRRSTLKILTQFAFIEDNFRGGMAEAERLKGKRDRLRHMRPDKEEDND
jgi:hypothetical protein